VQRDRGLIPAAATTLERTARRLFAVVLVVAMVTIITALAARWPRAESIVMGAIFAVAMAAVAGAAARRHSRRVLERHQYRLCPRCLSPLSGQDRCEVCGYPYGSASDVERLWRSLYERGG
jgi:hypothetical protein